MRFQVRESVCVFAYVPYKCRHERACLITERVKYTINSFIFVILILIS